jgi:hypothetical protein
VELAAQIVKLITEVLTLLVLLNPLFKKISERNAALPISKKIQSVTHNLGYQFKKLSVCKVYTFLKKPSFVAATNLDDGRCLRGWYQQYRA